MMMIRDKKLKVDTIKPHDVNSILTTLKLNLAQRVKSINKPYQSDLEPASVYVPRKSDKTEEIVYYEKDP